MTGDGLSKIFTSLNPVLVGVGVFIAAMSIVFSLFLIRKEVVALKGSGEKIL